MASSFGEQLRLAREARGISLREISEQTRISTRYLEAIEADDYKRLPGGIFNKSFIKAYAKYIGYDEKEALEAYMRTAREQGASPDDVVSTPYQPRVYTDGNSRSPLVTLFLTVLILAILSLGIYAALHWYQRRMANQVSENVNASPPATNANGSQSVNTSAATTNAAMPGPASSSAAPFNVQLRALGERVWIKAAVDDNDGAEAIIEPDDSKEFKPTQRLSILYAKSKARALEVKINGRLANVPPNPKGALAELVITKDDYQRFLQ
jgi:cytoskeleton protein RodZ